MPSYFFSSPTSQTEVDKIIREINRLISLHQNNETLSEILQSRYKEFTLILNNNLKNEEEKRLVMEQYYRFVCAVHSCLSSPGNVEHHINDYFYHKPYYPVGILENENKSIPTPTKHPLAMAGTVLGTALIIACVATLALSNPLIGLSLLGVGLSILIPSLFILLSKTPIDIASKQQEERDMLQLAATLMTNMPEVSITEPNENQIVLN